MGVLDGRKSIVFLYFFVVTVKTIIYDYSTSLTVARGIAIYIISFLKGMIGFWNGKLLFLASTTSVAVAYLGVTTVALAGGINIVYPLGTAILVVMTKGVDGNVITVHIIIALNTIIFIVSVSRVFATGLVGHIVLGLAGHTVVSAGAEHKAKA